jgi:hypothetical protein
MIFEARDKEIKFIKRRFMFTNLKVLIQDLIFPLLALFILANSMYVSGVPLSLPNLIMGLKLLSTIEEPVLKIVAMVQIYMKYNSIC